MAVAAAVAVTVAAPVAVTVRIFLEHSQFFLEHHSKTLAKFGDTVKENPFLFGAALVLLAVAVAVAVAFAGAVRCRHVHQFGHVRELTPEAGKL